MANDLNSNLEESNNLKSQILSSRISNKAEKIEEPAAKCPKNSIQKDHGTNE